MKRSASEPGLRISLFKKSINTVITVVSKETVVLRRRASETIN